MGIFAYILLGLVTGALSGIIGLGGGVFIVPSLVYIFDFTQQQAQGTTLALLVPPIGIFAAWTYYAKGFVNLQVAGLVCIGFVFGSVAGAKVAVQLSNASLSRIFGVALLLVSLKMIFSK